VEIAEAQVFGSSISCVCLINSLCVSSYFSLNMPNFSSVLLVCTIASIVGLGEANAFLRSTSQAAVGRVEIADVEAALLEELAGVIGHGSAQTRLTRLQEELRPMYQALPKNEHGKLGQVAVRYALHRFFVKRHGWFVKGLQDADSAQNSSSQIDILQDRVPSYIQGIFDLRSNGQGLGLQELAVLSATLEHLVHDEAINRLQKAFQFYSLPLTDRINEQDITKVVDMYMMLYIQEAETSNMTAPEIGRHLLSMSEIYPGWGDTQVWTRDVRNSVSYAERGDRNPFVGGDLDFKRTARIVETIGEDYGAWQDLECKDLKNALLRDEGQIAGRIPLSKFYQIGLAGKYLFTESVAYLREVGALDESDPTRPGVIVPNYLASPGNCLPSSRYYSICCVDECENLLGHLETELGKPKADPKHITALVAMLPSDTVNAPRNLSATLLRRLDEIAAIHSGSVPLHGRLFAQWMHHVYPRECPYPQAVKTNKQALDSMILSGGDAASRQEMLSHAKSAPADAIYATLDAQEEALPWSDVEDLFVSGQPESESVPSYSFSGLACNLFMLGAIGSVVWSLARDSKSALLPTHNSKLEKYSV